MSSVPPPPDAIRLQSRVPAWAAGQLLVDYLVRRFPYHDREAWEQHCRTGAVEVQGRPAAPDTVLADGARVAFWRSAKEPPVARDIVVHRVDADFVVATKPAHLPSHADGPFVQSTFIALLRGALGDEHLTLVHRLDRETSGLLVVARTERARASLHAQFQAGAIHKEYLAIVRGSPAADRFSIDGALAQAPGSVVSIRRAVVPPGTPGARPARTDFEVVTRLGDACLVRCRPVRGRTHQIRVHLEHAGHPLLGDKLYGRGDDGYLAFVHAVKAGADPRRQEVDGIARHLLHASGLRFRHPVSGAAVAFDSPLPDDMAAFVQQRATSGADPVA